MSRSSGLRRRGALVSKGPQGAASPLLAQPPAHAAPAAGLIVAPVEATPVVVPPVPRQAALGVADRIAKLKEAFERQTHSAPATPPAQWRTRLVDLATQIRAQQSRVFKTLAGLLVLIGVGWMPIRTLLETTSTEAIINARLVTLRAPIEGEVGSIAGSLSVGVELQPGAPLLRLLNPRADRGRLDDLRRLMDRLGGEKEALVIRRDELVRLHGDLAGQTAIFQEGRTRQLQAHALELNSEIAAAAANREEAERVVARYAPLAQTGTVTKAALEKAQRDVAVTAATHDALLHRLAAAKIELSALQQGIFIGDSYNDRPRSSQRADEIGEKLSEVNAQIREHEARLAGLRQELKSEADRFAALASAEISAPVRGSVWEVLTSPGETVVRGQELVRMLDCAGVVVTATVGETAYNRLHMGGQARFRFRGGSTDYQGHIIGLTGVATAPANLAIQPAALAKEPYRVTVALPGLVTPGLCDVGRTGRVTFGK
jgi:biotin carboxyl carrier protein